ncbi:MAG: hypothetical protein L3K00_03150 [Thermoplasmata archaeon]|nr:hypothetical protein [Thermoplasmata archaeon]
MGNGVGVAIAAIVVIVVAYLASVAFVQLEAPEVLGGADPGQSNASEPVAGQAVTFEGPALAVTPSTFWAVSAHPGCPSCFTSDPALGAFLSSTPVTWYRVGAGADACNITLDVAYNSSGDDVGACAVNLASFKDWCYSLTPHCHSIVQLPGENNNSGIDSSDVAYLEGTIGLYPDYWAIGNEPSDWIHYDEPWASWQPSDHNAPTAVAYAVDVRNAIEAIRGVDPFARFVGIENSGVNPSFLQNVTRIDGSLISWVAYHTYPGGTGGPAHPTLSEFYSLLNGSTSIPETYAEVRNSTDKYCSNCSALPISIGEYNGGTSNSTWTTYLDEFPNVIFTAASLTQALRTNVSDWTYFALDFDPFSLFNVTTNEPTDVGILYDTVFAKTVLGTVRPETVQTSVTGVWSVEVTNGSREWLLVANANLTRTVDLDPSPAFPSGVVGTEISWTNGSAAPSVVESSSLPSAYDLPPQSLLLLANY